MLIISRRKGQSILIDDAQVHLTVLNINPKKAKFGIKTVHLIAIQRKEIYTKQKINL